MTNLEFYKEDIKRKLCDFDFNRAICEVLNDDHAIDEYKLLDWLCEEHQILNEKEKEYLSNVIRPFKDRINYIYKQEWDYEKEAICINYDGDDEVALPDFKKGAMYKGMKVEKEYALKELGL